MYQVQDPTGGCRKIERYLNEVNPFATVDRKKIERGDQKKLRLEINKFFYWRKPNYIFGAAVLITLSIYFYCLFKKILEIIL